MEYVMIQGIKIPYLLKNCKIIKKRCSFIELKYILNNKFLNK